LDRRLRDKNTVSFKQKLREEIGAVALATLYFATWIGVLVLLKTLILAEYQIAFHGLSMVLIGALVLGKVVLVLEHVPLGAWVRTRPALIEVIFRTALYSFGVFVVILFEKAFEGRHEHGGFGPSLTAVFQHEEVHHVWANTICLSGALLGYNALSIVRRHLGKGGVIRLFLSPLPEESGPKHSGPSAPLQTEGGDRASKAPLSSNW
jgi:hypothetical protein